MLKGLEFTIDPKEILVNHFYLCLLNRFILVYYNKNQLSKSQIDFIFYTLNIQQNTRVDWEIKKNCPSGATFTEQVVIPADLDIHVL